MEIRLYNEFNFEHVKCDMPVVDQEIADTLCPEKRG